MFKIHMIKDERFGAIFTRCGMVAYRKGQAPNSYQEPLGKRPFVAYAERDKVTCKRCLRKG